MSDKKNESTENMALGVAEKTIAARRTALKALTAGGVIAGVALPERWTRPIVKAVVLPAHGQTTEEPPPGPSCEADMLFALINDFGTLIVVAEWNVPGSCIDEDTSSRGILCELVSNGVVLDSDDRSTAGGDCSTTEAPTIGCLVSCSMAMDEEGHSVNVGDSITMRFTFQGGCVCSVVDTVSSVG